MSEISDWLEGIGLAQYVGAFEANDIDMGLLRQVDDQMLKDIGVSSAGHRLRIRNAIAKLNPRGSARLSDVLKRATCWPLFLLVRCVDLIFCHALQGGP
jgi:hypothetical protein